MRLAVRERRGVAAWRARLRPKPSALSRPFRGRLRRDLGREISDAVGGFCVVCVGGVWCVWVVILALLLMILGSGGAW